MSAPSPLLFSLGLFFSAGACTAAVSLDGLATNSPFMLKQSENTAPVVTENASVEFRGMISTKDGVLFGLYDRTKNSSAWVKQDDKGGDFVVRSYDAAGDLVTVDYQGQKFTLPLSVAKIGAAMPSAVPVVNAPAIISGGNRVTAVPQAGGSKVDDQRRLESVAAEVRRRRALRQAAASGTPAPAAPTTGAGQ